jgi:diguanylate cyclase (GGDEF)-like protein/PAS domain S-box-containing protein
MAEALDQPMRILLVEDNPHDRAAFRRAMKGSVITECGRTSEAEACLATGEFDLVVIDNHLPGPAGIDLCRKLLPKSIGIPLVILTGSGSETLAVEALKLGVDDYLIKDPSGGYLDLLPHVLPKVIRRFHERQATARAEIERDESRIRLGQIVDGSPVAAFALDRERRVTHWNRACEILTGISARSVLGTTEAWKAFYPSQRPVMADLIIETELTEELGLLYPDKWRCSDHIEGAFEAEDFFPHLGGEGRWLFFTAAPLRDGAGRVIGAIETLQDFTARRKAEAALQESEERFRALAITDGLTGLFNSRHFYGQLELECERANRYGRPLAMLLLDADHFKAFNDTHGHQAGDKALVALADGIRRCLRQTDSGYRYGGEEFAILMPEATPRAAARLAERLRVDIASTPLNPAPDITKHITISIGVAEYARNQLPAEFVRRADMGAYRAKKAGRNCVVVINADEPVDTIG